MSSPEAWLDTRVRPRRKSGDVGIELEVEGTMQFGDDIGRYWDVKDEGSLRNGYEFVLKQPVELTNLPEALGHLKQTLDRSDIQHSIRCSTHVHVNVSHMTNRQIYQALGYYFLVEDLLVRTQGPLRMGNLFCLRMSDAESISHDLIRSIRTGSGFGSFSMDSHKYAAVNIAAVRKFGSVEFRFLRPLDTDKISMWSNLLYRMVDRAADIPLTRPLSLLESQQYREVLELVFTPSEIAMLIGQDGPPWQMLLEINAEYVFDMMKAMEEKKKFQMPTGTYEEDVELPGIHAHLDSPVAHQGILDEFLDDDDIDWDSDD